MAKTAVGTVVVLEVVAVGAGVIVGVFGIAEDTAAIKSFCVAMTLGTGVPRNELGGSFDAEVDGRGGQGVGTDLGLHQSRVPTCRTEGDSKGIAVDVWIGILRLATHAVDPQCIGCPRG